MKETQPLISIVTPSFNQGQFIEETIRSVLEQTYCNFEYIILDSKSDDNTHKILSKYSTDPRIKIIIEKDKGQTDAINKGFKLSNGDLVGWINSDDILEIDCLEKIVKEYNINKDAAIFYGDVTVIDQFGEYKNDYKVLEITYKNLLFRRPDVVQPGSFYNSEYVRRIGFLDETINYTMDYDLWLRLLKINKAVKINGELAKFRIHEDSKTGGKGNAIKFWRDIYRIRFKKHNVKSISIMDFRFLSWLFKSLFLKISKN